MTVKLVTACGALAMAAILAATPAAAATTFVLNNTNGGDGYVTGDSTNFDLFGSDNKTGGNITGYTGLATATQGYKATYTYTTNDLAGSFYDPAGYYINGAFKQLSPEKAPNGTSVSGVLRFRVHAGDTYGFYVASDGEFGRANIATAIASDVPEASTWVMLVAGFGIVGATLRRRNGAALTAAA
ncbi:PEPxxWA-CTERM sorting domain-containing protein [Polymorphobacter sp. PAMC 29334]|uniref:PEPxxWA-CTERM sorting domain-containing protein n=1 Tax=Polymorphobacter sp. PAMC 29334 TaxID=2862331 RepID=UPI001C763471|nr:PEPxxWA-CTERM sorting domain-containing protein [Polymorphobacter sp. PAMC 29334]QYE33899.1 PEPxxWA-CTERM sorting domain-containing protein [Polymorphobacter sp. PAMC 29334]